MVSNATELPVVLVYDTDPCNFLSLAPGRDAQDESRSKMVLSASNCLPDFFITHVVAITTRRRSLEWPVASPEIPTTRTGAEEDRSLNGPPPDGRLLRGVTIHRDDVGVSGGRRLSASS